MPNAGERAQLGSRQAELVDREAQIASKVREAADHPKALLLGAIGAMCSTPSESAKIAEEDLGLSKEEIQFARWVALFKKGKTRAEFLEGVRELLEDGKSTEIPEEKEMKVVRGQRYYASVVRNKIRPVKDWLYRRASQEIERRSFLFPLDVRQGEFPPRVYVYIVRSAGVFDSSVELKPFVYGNSEFQIERWKKDGWKWPDLHITIRDKKFFYLAQAIGKAYERRVKRECVTIERDYAVKS